eukprot:923288-Rhodomonas_salina.2
MSTILASPILLCVYPRSLLLLSSLAKLFSRAFFQSGVATRVGLPGDASAPVSHTSCALHNGTRHAHVMLIARGVLDSKLPLLSGVSTNTQYPIERFVLFCNVVQLSLIHI